MAVAYRRKPSTNTRAENQGEILNKRFLAIISKIAKFVMTPGRKEGQHGENILGARRHQDNGIC